MNKREPHFYRFVLGELQPFLDRFPIRFLQGERGCRLAYRHITHSESAERKLMILVNGRGENLLKWSENAYDFYRQGFDVLLFDHRGQGYSQRILKDHHKGHLDEFRFYVQDMATIICHIQKYRAYQEHYLIAHSLGALISTYYLANYDHHIKSAVFSAPFFGLPLHSPIRDEFVINMMVLLGQGHRYVFGKTSYKPLNLQNNAISFCKTRLRWINRLNRLYPILALGGPTFRWVHLCLTAIKKLPRILPNIEIPVLILQAEKERIVNNDRLPYLISLLKKGQCIEIEKANHEILFESDEIRHLALSTITDFFRKSFDVIHEE